MNKTQSRPAKPVWQTMKNTALALGLAAQAGLAAAAVKDLPGGPAVNQLDMHPPASAIAANIHWLHYAVMGICVVIFIGVFGVMFYSMWAHRKSRGAKPADPLVAEDGRGDGG